MPFLQQTNPVNYNSPYQEISFTSFTFIILSKQRPFVVERNTQVMLKPWRHQDLRQTRLGNTDLDKRMMKSF